jgi:hypothetical protein
LSTARLRRFGLAVGLGLAMVGALYWYREFPRVASVLWLIGAALVICGVTAPALLTPLERRWLQLGAVLAWVNTRVILSVLFYLVFTPLGLVMRLFRDPLDRRLHDERESYWIRRPGKPADQTHYERQF